MILEKVKTKRLQKSVRLIFSIAAILLGALAAVAQTQAINVTVDQSKINRGGSVEVTIKTRRGEAVRASFLKPTVGAEDMALQKIPGAEDIYRATIRTGQNAPAGMYVVHAWAGEKANPSAVGKASFRIGNIVQDFFIANYLDKQNPARDIENYLSDFRAVGGNFLIAHNLIIAGGAFYPSKIAKTDVERGSARDVVEELLKQADRAGIGVLLSVGWDVTRNSHYKDRMKEVNSLISEMYTLYRHHPSLAGFYSWQEGSGTYYAPFMREFSEHVKSHDRGLLTACAPHIDDPLLASYLSVIEELDILIYQSAVMGSYRTDNRKKYPWRRVRDFAGLGAGAKRLQNKITLTHVELFGYLEKRQIPGVVTASYADIYGQILSAAAVTDTDGISLFTYHAQIYEPLKKFKQVEKSLEAVAKGLKAYQLITSQVSAKRNPLALYVPYSDFVIERWANYFLPALDAFRTLGIPFDILPYAPRMDESIYPYYPIHHNQDVLERLLREKTVLVLANVSGFQQTDSDLIKPFVERGGVIVAFGGQIPMGRSYERKDLFGGEEIGEKTQTKILVKNSIGKRVAAAKQISFPATLLSSWSANSAQVIAAYEDGTAAVLVNKFGKGTVITILPDAGFAARFLPALVRDAFDYALASSANKALVDVSGTNENFDVAVNYKEDGFSAAVINHNLTDFEVTLKAQTKISSCSAQQGENVRKEIRLASEEVKLKIPGNEFSFLECRFK